MAFGLAGTWIMALSSASRYMIRVILSAAGSLRFHYLGSHLTVTASTNNAWLADTGNLMSDNRLPVS